MMLSSTQQRTVDRKMVTLPLNIVQLIEKLSLLPEGSFFYQQYIVEEKEGSFFYQQYVVEWKERSFVYQQYDNVLLIEK
jgi:hypothetical protein